MAEKNEGEVHLKFQSVRVTAVAKLAELLRVLDVGQTEWLELKIAQDDVALLQGGVPPETIKALLTEVKRQEDLVLAGAKDMLVAPFLCQAAYFLRAYETERRLRAGQEKPEGA